MLKFILSLFIFSYANTIYAAQNGALGLSSTGSANITFIKHALVKVSNLDDFDLNEPSSLGEGIWHDDICVVSSSGAYKIVTYSKKGGSAGYSLKHKNLTKSIGYAINFSPDSSATSGDALRPGIESASYPSAQSGSCSGGVNSRVFLTVDKNSLNTADPGEYADVLTLIVYPL